MPEDERRYTFPRAHRLKQQRLIRSLFDRRRADVGTVAVGAVRLLYRVMPRADIGQDVPVKIGLAPGRRVRSGVERNRVRRLLREVYRRHQHVLTDLFEGTPHALVIMALFRGDPAQAAARLPRDLPAAMKEAARRLQTTEAPGAQQRAAARSCIDAR